MPLAARPGSVMWWAVIQAIQLPSPLPKEAGFHRRYQRVPEDLDPLAAFLPHYLQHVGPVRRHAAVTLQTNLGAAILRAFRIVQIAARFLVAEG